MNAAWWAQPFAPDGSAASEGIQRQLGAPRADPLTVLVRETAQNSWDARRHGATVEFSMDLSRPDAAVRAAWRELVLPGSERLSGVDLAACLESPRTTFLTVSDRGTSGLGGPLRADRVAAGPSDFVDFVRNVGEPRSKQLSGGTYGFGKGVLYTTSAIGLVVIRTRCIWEGGVQTRVIGAALGRSFSRGGRRYTGRHWWGRVADDGCPDPVLSRDADALARALGFPERAPNELGTDVLIVDAQLGTVHDDDAETARDRDLDDAGEYLASAMLWHLWPLLLSSDGESAPMRCAVSAGGTRISIPDPSSVLRLRPFVDAYRAAHGANGEVLERKRPLTQLGRFAARTHMAPIRRHWTDAAVPFDGAAHHCALMRQAGLVVRYRPGPPFPEPTVQYGAVFRSLGEVDDAFAESEPPTHDDWVVEKLVDRDQRSRVRTALKRVDERLNAIAAQGVDRRSGDDGQPPLGALSSRMSTLVPVAGGAGAEDPPGGRRRSGGIRRGRPGARITDGPRLTLRNGLPVIVASLQADATAELLLVTVTASVALDTGEESDPPAGADSPEVLELLSEDRRKRVAGPCLRLASDDPRRWTVFVRPAAGAATRVRVSAVSG